MHHPLTSLVVQLRGHIRRSSDERRSELITLHEPHLARDREEIVGATTIIPYEARRRTRIRRRGGGRGGRRREKTPATQRTTRRRRAP